VFKVPRYYFEHNSNFFKKAFELLPKNTGDQILRLGGVNAHDFRLLLKASYPHSLWGELGPPDQDETSQQRKQWTREQWATVLKLSAMWQMEKVQEKAISCIVHRNLRFGWNNTAWIYILRSSTEWGTTKLRERAIRQLDNNIQGADRICLGMECRIGEWFLSGCMELVVRDDEISLMEEKAIGWGMTSKLFRLRHRYIQGQIDDDGLHSIIFSELQKEFHFAQDASGLTTSDSLLPEPRVVSVRDLGGLWVPSMTVSFDSVVFQVRSVTIVEVRSRINATA
jgi:hypothetical protein